MNKLQSVDKKSRTLKLDLTGEAEISTGPKMEMGLEVFGDAMKAEVSAQVGVKVAAKLNQTAGQISEEDAIHACALCLDGEAKWFVTADAGLSVKFMEFETKLNATLFNAEGWIDFEKRHPGSFFVSIINDADSVYGGRLTFKGGECQNKKIKTTFEVEDAQGTKIESELSIKKVGDKSTINATSPLTTYLYKGAYIAKASVLDVSVSKTFSVDEDAQVITLTAHSADGTLTGTVIDAITNNPLSDVSIVATQGEQKVAATKTNSAGAFSIAIPAGDISIRISKDGYTAYTCYETVQDGETRNIPVIRLVPGNGKGGFSGQITDATTGNPVEGVTLRLRAGWNNSEVGDIIRTLTTDSDGGFEYNMVTLGGLVIHGLDAGNYTLTASKAGYENSSFNVVVYPGVVTSGQDGTITSNGKTIPDDAAYFNGHAYKVYDESATWTEVKNHCELLGGHLATITSENEQQFIIGLLNQGSKRAYWLGASDSTIEGHWEWVTGENWSYTNWDTAHSQPDNAGTGEHYLQIYNAPTESNADSYKWNDQANDNANYYGIGVVGYICEW